MTPNQIETLLQMVSEIADPAEEIRQKATQIAQDAQTAPETAQACADLSASIRELFQIASIIMKSQRAGQ